MTTDLWILVASALLQWALIMAATTPRLLKNGLSWALGNRSAEGVVQPEWAIRTQRASDNLAENLVLFAILVLVVHVSGKASATTALGAQVFFWGRVAHAGIFIAGIPVARTLAWSVSIVGMVIVLSGLF